MSAGCERGIFEVGIIGCGRIASAIEDKLLDAPMHALLPYSHAGAYERVPIIPVFARTARAPVMTVVQQEFVEAARAVGVGNLRLLLRHVLPNISTPLIVQASLSFSAAMLDEAALSFLGLGVQPPGPSWGRMLADARRYMEAAPWMAVFPGLAIMMAVLSLNLLGDGLRDYLDPRLRRQA